MRRKKKTNRWVTPAVLFSILVAFGAYIYVSMGESPEIERGVPERAVTGSALEGDARATCELTTEEKRSLLEASEKGNNIYINSVCSRYCNCGSPSYTGKLECLRSCRA